MGLTTRIIAGTALLALVGCGVGQSRLNPLNWFGRDTSETIEVARATTSQPVVDQVLSLEAAQTPGGAIISTVGLPPTQGFWEAELVQVPADDPGVLLLEFRILPPVTRQPVGTQPSREVLAGRVFTTQDLAGVRTITVRGARNQRSIRR
ncbi:hypothetical protein [uncultured Jannaschia sp.]|uniref:hypothetical protein n=1 Tax=Jannaschia halovivens TaxID=3388667 RepID=UPI0026120528|nr:hypothetical protein [uncultured Jannaschia sp.]